MIVVMLIIGMRVVMLIIVVITFRDQGGDRRILWLIAVQLLLPSNSWHQESSQEISDED